MRLCPRAITVIERQLRLRERLAREGRIDHDRLFFTDSGRPLSDLKYPYTRWQRTLRRLAIRYRKPYMARHTSVSCRVGRRISPPASRRTEREALASLSSHQINEPIIPTFQ